MTGYGWQHIFYIAMDKHDYWEEGHPYITSSYFGPFWTHPLTLLYIQFWKSEKMAIFLDPSTQSFRRRNIGMASKKNNRMK